MRWPLLPVPPASRACWPQNPAGSFQNKSSKFDVGWVWVRAEGEALFVVRPVVALAITTIAKRESRYQHTITSAVSTKPSRQLSIMWAPKTRVSNPDNPLILFSSRTIVCSIWSESMHLFHLSCSHVGVRGCVCPCVRACTLVCVFPCPWGCWDRISRAPPRVWGLIIRAAIVISQ